MELLRASAPISTHGPSQVFLGFTRGVARSVEAVEDLMEVISVPRIWQKRDAFCVPSCRGGLPTLPAPQQR